MKKIIAYSGIIAGLFLLIMVSSCTKNDPTTGMMTITVVDKFDLPVASQAVYLAESWGALSGSEFQKTGWTDDKGKVKFIDLKPGTYWYSTQDYDNYGAATVVAGYDTQVILVVFSKIDTNVVFKNQYRIHFPKKITATPPVLPGS